MGLVTSSYEIGHWHTRILLTKCEYVSLASNIVLVADQCPVWYQYLLECEGKIGLGNLLNLELERLQKGEKTCIRCKTSKTWIANTQRWGEFSHVTNEKYM